MEIYFKPHCKRLKEKIFFNYINSSIEKITHINANFVLPFEMINHLLNRDEIIDMLEKDTLLPSKRRTRCIEELNNLPLTLLIAKRIEDITIDFVIKNENVISYIEFHESQHSKLSVGKSSPIFSDSSEEYRIPRFLQRLLRDIWRWKYLDNFKIVWWEWFEENNDYKMDFFTKGKSEYYLKDKFSFINLVNHSS